MLVITRKAGDSFVIGDEITVTIIEQRGKNVRVGIEAPREIPILRSEILLKGKVDSAVVKSPPPAIGQSPLPPLKSKLLQRKKQNDEVRLLETS